MSCDVSPSSDYKSSHNRSIECYFISLKLSISRSVDFRCLKLIFCFSRTTLKPLYFHFPRLKFQISLLHLAVITMLCGAVTLFIGLVQLKPGAEASQYRYILIGCGLGATLLGIAVAILRCCLLPIVARKRERRRDEYRKQQCAQYCVGHHCVHTTTTTMASATNTPDGQTKQTASNDQLADLEAANAVN